MEDEELVSISLSVEGDFEAELRHGAPYGVGMSKADSMFALAKELDRLAEAIRKAAGKIGCRE